MKRGSQANIRLSESDILEVEVLKEKGITQRDCFLRGKAGYIAELQTSDVMAWNRSQGQGGCADSK